MRRCAPFGAPSPIDGGELTVMQLKHSVEDARRIRIQYVAAFLVQILKLSEQAVVLVLIDTKIGDIFENDASI